VRGPVSVSHGVLAALTVLAVLPCLGEGLMLYDLGELVYFADAVGDRQIPGRDYAINAYGPGRYFLLAGLWELLGRNFFVVWGLFLALRLAITATSWEISRRLLGKRWSYLPVILLILVPGPLHKGFYLLGTLVLALAFVLSVGKDRWRVVGTWFSLGVVIAFVALFRLDLGGFGGLVALFVLYATRSPLKMVVPLALPLVTGLLVAGGLLANFGTDVLPAVVSQLGDDIFKNQTIQYPSMPGLAELLAFQSWNPYLLWLPLPVYLATFGLLARRWTRDSTGRLSQSSLALACIFLLGVLTCNQLWMKPEYGHLLQTGPMLWLCVAIVLRRLGAAGGRAGLFAAGVAVLVLVSVLMITTVTISRGSLYTGAFTIPWERNQPLDTPLGQVDLSAGEHAEIGPMLETLSDFPPGPIWVPTNQPLYFALSGREDVTGHVGVVYYADDIARQIEIIGRLEEARPRLAIFVDDSIEGPERRLANAAPQIYSYLMTHYAPLVTYGRHQLMKRRGPVGLKNPAAAPQGVTPHSVAARSVPGDRSCWPVFCSS